MKTAALFMGLVAALLLLSGAGAQAQAVKKYITPDGRTIYSDKPVPGAREAGEIAAPQAVDPAARTQAEDDARRASELEREADQRIRERAAQQARIDAAEAQLQAAREALANGKEPLPGERIGTVSGKSRLTDAYFRRQSANEQAVIDAQRQLEAVRATIR